MYALHAMLNKVQEYHGSKRLVELVVLDQSWDESSDE